MNKLVINMMILCICKWFIWIWERVSSLNANAITTLSTFGLFALTTILAIYAYRTFNSTEKYNRLQAIKDTVFKLIDFHYRNLESISVRHHRAEVVVPNDPVIVSGVRAFESLYEDFVNTYNKINNNDYDNNEEEIIKVAFYDLYRKNSQIGSYYKNLYLLIQYIDMKGSQDIEGFDIQYYIKLIKAQLSKYEILMLAYNCIWIHGETGKEEDREFLKLAEKVKLLSALEKEELIKPSHIELLERYKA